MPILRKAKSLFLILFAGTVMFLILLGGICLYVNYCPHTSTAVGTASRLPGTFVSDCQKVSATTDIPWTYLAAYFQLSVEASQGDYKYPPEAQIKKLADMLINPDGSTIMDNLRSTFGDEQAELVIEQAKILDKGSFLFSEEYTFPVEQKHTSYTDTWLASRDGGERKHFGTDIFAPQGTPVYACTNGKIVRIGWDRLGGNRIGLRGKDGIYYYYAHLCRYAKGIQEGTKVSPGTVLGYVGHTGNAVGTPDHLHFGLLLGRDNWVNPYNFLVYWGNRKESIEN